MFSIHTKKIYPTYILFIRRQSYIHYYYNKNENFYESQHIIYIKTLYIFLQKFKTGVLYQLYIPYQLQS